jgi:hypothetical protein
MHFGFIVQRDPMIITFITFIDFAIDQQISAIANVIVDQYAILTLSRVAHR